MLRKLSHTALTEAFFRSKAASWSANYGTGGGMGDRIALFVSEFARRLPRGAEILDFGCGSGNIARRLAEEGWRVTGCDSTAEMIAMAQAEDADNLVRWQVIGSALALPFAVGRFDAVLVSSVLEYVDSPKETIQALAHALRPGGLLIASVPDLRHLSRRRERWRRCLLLLPGAAWLASKSRWAEGAHYLRISRNRFPIARWIDLLAQCGFHVEPVSPCSGALAVLIAYKK